MIIVVPTDQKLMMISPGIAHRVDPSQFGAWMSNGVRKMFRKLFSRPLGCNTQYQSTAVATPVVIDGR